jgi:hypothetical protein
MAEKKPRRSRVLEYFEQQKQQEPEQDDGLFGGLDASFGLTDSGKE